MAGPNEVVDFIEDDPGPFTVEPEMALHPYRNFDRGYIRPGRPVGDGKHINPRFAVSPDRDHYHSRGPVLAAFLSLDEELSAP